MGWNPQINFKLRDDEITFGDLIFDKGSAELLCKALTAIKNGQSVGNDVIKSIIENGCYTDKELEALRKEFDEIKNDISYFKKLRASGFTSGISNWAKRVDANINYVTGSNTWIEKYKELKLCACEMYESLLGKNYAFTPQEKATFDKRYGDVLKSTTSKERLDGVLRKQYYEDLEAGVPNAADIYIQAQVDNGIITEQQAEGKRKLFGAASKSVVKTDLASDFEGDTFGTYNADGKEVGVHVEDTANSLATIVVTYDMLISKLEQIGKISDANEKALTTIKFFNLVKDGFTEAGIDVRQAGYTCKYYGDETHNIKAGDVYKAVHMAIVECGVSVTSSLFDSVSYKVKKSDWDSIVKETKKRDTFTLTAEKFKEMFYQVKSITDYSKSAKCCIILLNLVKSKFEKVPGNISYTIGGLLLTDAPAGAIISGTEEVVNTIVTSPEYSKILDDCHEEIDTSWWNRQLQ